MTFDMEALLDGTLREATPTPVRDHQDAVRMQRINQTTSKGRIQRVTENDVVDLGAERPLQLGDTHDNQPGPARPAAVGDQRHDVVHEPPG